MVGMPTPVDPLATPLGDNESGSFETVTSLAAARATATSISEIK